MYKIKPEISVVLPVYNVERYLDECIQSILNQSFENFELLIINDGSTDNSLQICEKYALIDNRINIFIKVNGGLSSARNTGLDQATGEYIVFIDSDDCLHVDYLKILYQTIKQYNCDIIVSGYNLYPLNKNIVSKFKKNEVMSGRDFILSNPNIHSHNDLCFVWRNIYNLNIIKLNNIRFNESIFIGEDVAFNLEVILKSSRVMATLDCLYSYRIDNNSSLMRQKYKFRLEESLIKQYEIRKNLSYQYGLLKDKNYVQDLSEYYVKNIYRLLLNNSKNNPEKNLKLDVKRILELEMIRDSLKICRFKSFGSTFKEYLYFISLKYKIIPVIVYIES